MAEDTGRGRSGSAGTPGAPGPPGADGHWVAWHRPYDDPSSALSRRLAAVQSRIAAALDRRPPGPITVISMCAGEGRDLIGALRSHPRAADVAARLVEADPHNAATAGNSARAARLAGVSAVVGDAGVASAYAGMVPADLALVCGVFGNISEADIEGTIGHLPELLADGGTVVWTRHRRPPDLTPLVRRWFAEAGFDEVGFDRPEGDRVSVGSHRLAVPPRPFDQAAHLFTFTGDGALPA